MKQHLRPKHLLIHPLIKTAFQRKPIKTTYCKKGTNKSRYWRTVKK